MIANGVDGMLITIPGNTDGHLILPENLRVPVVTIEENSGIIQGDCVQTSCTQGAYEIISDCQRENERIFQGYGGLWNSCKTGICCSG